MDPQEKPPNSRSGQPEPLFHAPFKHPGSSKVVVPASTVPSEADPAKSRLILMIGIAAGVEFLIIVVLIVLFLTHGPSPGGSKNNANGANQQRTGPTAATSDGVQLINDSVTQDIGSLNDDTDLPADRLSDQNLGL